MLNSRAPRVIRLRVWLVGLSLLLPILLRAAASDAPTTLAELKGTGGAPLPPRVGAVAGLLGDAIVVGGGVEPRSGQSLTDATWGAGSAGQFTALESIGRLPTWSASAQIDGSSLAVIGGLDENGRPLQAVLVLRREGAGAKVDRLPDLPHPLVGAGAAVIGTKLYVVGGMQDRAGAQLENALWLLDLARPADGWRALEPLPGAARVLPTVTAQYDVLHVFGGRVREGAGFAPSAEVWIYRPAPLEGTVQRGWQARTALPRAMAAGVAVPSGQAHTFVLGGDASAAVSSPLQITPAPAPAPVLLYHALTDAWADTGLQLALTSGHGLRSASGDLVLLGGAEGVAPQRLQPIRRTRDLAWIDYAMVAGYFVLLGGIGWYFSRQQESSVEFSLGSRSVQWWAAGISMFATGASAISFMAVPALAFATNLVWVFPVIMNLAGFFVQAYVIFPMLRKLQLTSTYEYLEQRFNVPLRLIASLQQILFLSFGRAAVVLVLPAIAIATTTGLNVYVSVVLMGVLTTIYTTVGGFKAVIWTEVFQGGLKFLAPIAMIVVCLISLPGGVGQFFDIGARYHKFDIALLTWDITVPALWMMLLNNFLQFTVQLAGDQPMIQRVFSAPAHEVRRVAAMNVACGILIGVVVNIMGIAIFAYFHAHPERLDAGSQNDQIVPLFATQALPAGLAGIVIAAIFASAMATVASNMNSVATIFTEDFYKRWRPDAPDGSRLRVLKLSSYAVGLIGTVTAVVLAGLNIKSMMATWNVIMSLLGGGIVGVYSLGMLTTRANGTGAVWGAILSVVVMLLVRLFTPIHWAFYMPCAIGVCMGAGYLISLLFPDERRDLTGLTIFTPRRETTSS